MVLNPSQQHPIQRQGSNDRQMVPAKWYIQDRRLTARGIGMHQSWQQTKACFVHKHHRLPTGDRSLVKVRPFDAAPAPDSLLIALTSPAAWLLARPVDFPEQSWDVMGVILHPHCLLDDFGNSGMVPGFTVEAIGSRPTG